jgi:hypothetical protein
VNDPRVQKRFRQIIATVRMYDKYKHIEDRAFLLPFDFLTLLAALQEKTDRN